MCCKYPCMEKFELVVANILDIRVHTFTWTGKLILNWLSGWTISLVGIVYAISLQSLPSPFHLNRTLSIINYSDSIMFPIPLFTHVPLPEVTFYDSAYLLKIKYALNLLCHSVEIFGILSNQIFHINLHCRNRWLSYFFHQEFFSDMA